MKNILSLTLVATMAFSVVTAVSAAEYRTVGLKIDGMTCGSCVDKVQTSLKKVEGVKEAEVTLATHTAKVVYDPSKTDEKALKGSVSTAGFKVSEVKAWDKSMGAKSESSEKSGCCGGGTCADKASKKQPI